MRQEEIDARDIHDDRDANPVVETELGELLERRAFKDGTVDWIEQSMDFVSQATALQCDDAYSMGIAASERERPYRKSEPVIDSYQYGKLDGYNEGRNDGYDCAYIKGRRDGIEVGKRMVWAEVKAEADKMMAKLKGEHGTD